MSSQQASSVSVVVAQERWPSLDILLAQPRAARPPRSLRTDTIDRIEIGACCSIADEVRIINFGGQPHDANGDPLDLVLRGHHLKDSPTTYPVGNLVPDEPYDEPPPGARTTPLCIGDDVWIGYGARVFGQVSVGTGAVIGSGAMVLRDVPPSLWWPASRPP